MYRGVMNEFIDKTHLSIKNNNNNQIGVKQWQKQNKKNSKIKPAKSNQLTTSCTCRIIKCNERLWKADICLIFQFENFSFSIFCALGF